LLKGKYAIKSDTLQGVEHSVEALIPWLQYFNKNIKIIPVLVPAMTPDRMKECGMALADAIRTVAGRHRWEWGRDFAVVGSTDAVHYGNEEWGGSDYAFFGCDSLGNRKAVEHEKEIIENCLSGPVSPDRIKLFSSYTLKPENYKEYQWTWCGRYSVPVTLYITWFLNDNKPLYGEVVGYSTSLLHKHIPVDDLRMGRTAIATACHWVGYAALGYR
jgi:MEMO1 family protein